MEQTKDIQISLKNISYAYPLDEEGAKKEALKDITLDIEKGSFVAILGHNGSGKSTLAKVMCMIIPPDEGTLTIDGVETTAENCTDDDIYNLRRDIGMVFQNPDNQLVATIVEEDVAFGPENLGVPSEQIRKNVDEALATVRMTKYARHETHRLSGGQKQRIAIAGVLAMHRSCIIFDESTAMLDPRGRKEVMDTICRLHDDGITIVMITHYMAEATLADRVVVMNNGKIVADNTPGAVFSEVEKLHEIGLDVPQTTELLWNVKKAGYDVRLDIFDPDECAKEIARAVSKK